jgi:excisionase family DNA binding protein
MKVLSAPDTSEYMLEVELATRLRVSRRHVINLRNQRLIPYLRLGKSVRYRWADVQRALKKLEVDEH